MDYRFGDWSIAVEMEPPSVGVSADGVNVSHELSADGLQYLYDALNRLMHYNHASADALFAGVLAAVVAYEGLDQRDVLAKYHTTAWGKHVTNAGQLIYQCEG